MPDCQHILLEGVLCLDPISAFTQWRGTRVSSTYSRFFHRISFRKIFSYRTYILNRVNMYLTKAGVYPRETLLKVATAIWHWEWCSQQPNFESASYYHLKNSRLMLQSVEQLLRLFSCSPISIEVEPVENIFYLCFTELLNQFLFYFFQFSRNIFGTRFRNTKFFPFLPIAVDDLQ